MSETTNGPAGGRPAKDAADKRSVKLQTHLTPGEAAAVKVRCQAAGLSVAAYLRRLATEHEVRGKANPVALRKLRAELGSIGGNINQIAKKVNQGEISDLQETDFRALIAYLYHKLEEL